MKKCMKYSKNIILIIILTMIILPFFLISRTTIAQEYTYNGADTEKIPGFSVYPSEWYIMNTTGIYSAPENYSITQIIKGNITDWFETPGGIIYPSDNGINVWASIIMVNSTSGKQSFIRKEISLAWWNESLGFLGLPPTILPVEEDGMVSMEILENVTDSWEVILNNEGVFFNSHSKGRIFPYYCYFELLNTNTGAYWFSKFTLDGIAQKIEHHLTGIPLPNITLISRPAQLPPDLTFTTETGSLILDSTDFKLNISIMDADNDNDGDIDTDYLYRIKNGTTWSDWAIPPNQVDWDLGDVAAGSYGITIEIKNMYGVTQKDITIQYSPPEGGEPPIPGHPIALISFTAIFSISIIILRYRKKMRL